jgi:hypothetical protein
MPIADRAASESDARCGTDSRKYSTGSRPWNLNTAPHSSRKVTASATTAKQAKQNLRAKLQRRNAATGFGDEISPESTVSELATAWLEYVQARSGFAPGTKDPCSTTRCGRTPCNTIRYVALHASNNRITPHTFRRTAGTVIARATDEETAAEILAIALILRGSATPNPRRHYRLVRPRSTRALSLHATRSQRGSASANVAKPRLGEVDQR